MAKFWAKVESVWNTNAILAWVLLICVAGIVLWATFKPQSPGVSIGLLALAAGVMSVRPAMHPAEKAAWLIFLVGFAVLEVSAIGRTDHENTEKLVQQDRIFSELRAAQDRDFVATIKGITDGYALSQKQFTATMRKSESLLNETRTISSLTVRNLNAVTGGDGRPYFDLFFEQDTPNYVLSLANMSDHPFRNLQATIQDVNKTMNLFESRDPHVFYREDVRTSEQAVKIGDIGVSQVFTMTNFSPEQRGNDLLYLRVYFTALSGAWGEEMIVRKNQDGKRFRATRRMDEKGLVEKLDPGFPLNSEGKIGW